MTWRELFEGLAALPAALKALRELQQVASVQVASLKDTDVIVVETERMLPQRGRENIAQMVKSIWPNNRVVIWDSGLRMRVVASAPIDEQAGVH